MANRRIDCDPPPRARVTGRGRDSNLTVGTDNQSRGFRMNRVLSFALCCWLASTAIATAQTGDAAAAIAGALGAFKPQQQYRGEFVQVYTFTNPEASVEGRRTIVFGGRDRFFVEDHLPVHRLSYVSEQTRWTYAPELHQYTQEPYHRSVDPIEITSLERVAAMTPLDPSFLPDETLAVNGRAYRCRVLRAHYGFDARAEAVTVTFYLDQGGTHLRRMVTLSPRGSVSLTILSLEIQPAIPDSEFHFIPPDDATRVASLVWEHQVRE